MRLVIATRNKGKIQEIDQLLQGTGVVPVGLDNWPTAPEVVEDAETFEGNACKKAQTIAAFTGEWTLADDSGLAVIALGGLPGVHSARFAGEDADDEDNNKKLIQLMAGIPEEERGAAFCCAMAICSPQGGCQTFYATVEGRILERPRGKGGFGYDPYFYFEEFKQTTAELSMEVKNRISHRGKALKQAVVWLKEELMGKEA